MAKTIDALAKSRRSKARVLAYMGGTLPDSIMAADWSERVNDKFAAGPDKGRWNKTGIKDFDMSFDPAATISRFPINIGRQLLLFYTADGARVLDPFAGHNSRLELCIKAGREYWASDIQPDYMAFNRTIYSRIQRQVRLFGDAWPDAQLVTGDSRSLPFADASCDFMITSPPYWNLEFYGDQPEQLYYSKTYDAFLASLFEVFTECHRILKPGAFGAVFVNDFRRDHHFYPYHADCMLRFRDIGFELWDIVIVDLGRAIRTAWVAQAIQQQVIPKRHEYAIIIRKPTGLGKKENAYDRRKLDTIPEVQTSSTVSLFDD